MSDRFQDPNWGKHGNPNNLDWLRTPRELNQSNTTHWNKHKDRPLFHDGTDVKISVWTIFWVIALIFILSGFSDTARGIIFYGINITENWYSSVDSLLDALGAPKLP